MARAATPRSSYPVLFCVVGEKVVAGSLIVLADQLLLEGGAAAELTTLHVDLGDLCEVRIARAPAERLNGHSVLVLGRSSGPDVCVAPLGPGLLHEIANLIATFAASGPAPVDRIAAVVPLKPGTQARVRELVAEGPPLDPAALGLREHVVALRGNEVVFVFTGSEVRQKIERAAHRPALWRAGLAWRACLAGAPWLTTSPVLDGSDVLYRWRADDD
jgi:hypothetical protein